MRVFRGPARGNYTNTKVRFSREPATGVVMLNTNTRGPCKLFCEVQCPALSSGDHVKNSAACILLSEGTMRIGVLIDDGLPEMSQPQTQVAGRPRPKGAVAMS